MCLQVLLLLLLLLLDPKLITVSILMLAQPTKQATGAKIRSFQTSDALLCFTVTEYPSRIPFAFR